MIAAVAFASLVLLVASLRAEGLRWDPTFAPTIVANATDPLAAGAFLVQPDGRILVFGALTLNGSPIPRLIRLMPDGQRDLSYAGYTASADPSAPVPIGKLVLSNDRVVFPLYNRSGSPTVPLVRLSAAGTLDPSFHATIDSSFSKLLSAPDGKIFVVGPGLFRLNDDGSVDSSFSWQPPTGFQLNDAAVQPDGKIVTIGSLARRSDPNVFRFLPDGTLDPAFISNAVADSGGAIVLQPSGKMLIGSAGFVVRLNTDGSSDPTFQPTPIDSGDMIDRVLEFPDGRLGIVRRLGPAIVLKADGGIDQTFSLPNSNNEWFTLAAALPDGRFVAIEVGPWVGFGGSTHSVVALQTDGSVDSSFQAKLGYPGSVDAIWIDRDGTVLIGGKFDAVNGQPRGGVARFTPDGRLDPTFVPPARAGIVTRDQISPLPDGTGYFVLEITDPGLGEVPRIGDYVRYARDGSLLPWQLNTPFIPGALAPGVERTGSIVVPDRKLTDSTGTEQTFVLERHNADGSVVELPTTFSVFPFTLSSFGQRQPLAVVPLHDGTLLLRGAFTTINGTPKNGLARINADGSLTPTSAAESPPLFDSPASMFGAAFEYVDGRSELRLVRLRQDGSRDTTFAADRAYNEPFPPIAQGIDGNGRIVFKSYVGDVFRLSASGAFDPSAQIPTLQGAVATASDGTIYLSGNGGLFVRYAPADIQAITAQPQDVATVVGRAAQFDVGWGGASPATYQWYHQGTLIPGATRATLTIDPTSLSDAGTYSATVTSGGTTITSTAAMLTLTPSDARITNFSGRSRTSTGETQQIIGFVRHSDSGVPILIRAAGPSLAALGVSDPVAHPMLSIISAAGDLVTQNSGWSGDSIAQAAIRLGAFPFAAGSTDAAIYQSFDSGAFTAHVNGSAGGIALSEIYPDPPANTPSGIVNFSIRANAGTGDNAVIAGFVVTGTGPQKVLIRAVGPSLAHLGVSSPLLEPMLHLNGRLNDYLLPVTHDVTAQEPGTASAATTVGAFPLDPTAADVATVASLEPGVYTASVTGTAGVVLIEVYALPE